MGSSNQNFTLRFICSWISLAFSSAVSAAIAKASAAKGCVPVLCIGNWLRMRHSGTLRVWTGTFAAKETFSVEQDWWEFWAAFYYLPGVNMPVMAGQEPVASLAKLVSLWETSSLISGWWDGKCRGLSLKSLGTAWSSSMKSLSSVHMFLHRISCQNKPSRSLSGCWRQSLNLTSTACLAWMWLICISLWARCSWEL